MVVPSPSLLVPLVVLRALWPFAAHRNLVPHPSDFRGFLQIPYTCIGVFVGLQITPPILKGSLTWSARGLHCVFFQSIFITFVSHTAAHFRGYCILNQALRWFQWSRSGPSFCWLAVDQSLMLLTRQNMLLIISPLSLPRIFIPPSIRFTRIVERKTPQHKTA